MDDGVDQSVVNYLFPRREPVVIYGSDYSFRMGRKQKYRIGFLTDQERGYFTQAVYNSIQESAATYDNLSLVIRETSSGFFSTAKNVDMLLNDRLDLIINYSLCTESVTYVAEKCRIRGVKLITVDLQCPDSVYFGADNAVAGTLAGSHTVEFIQRCWHGQLDKIIIFARHGMDYITNRRVMNMVDKIHAGIYPSFLEPEIIEWDNPNEKPKEKLLRLLIDTPKNSRVLFITFNVTFLVAIHDIILQYRDANNTIIVGQNFNKMVQEFMKMPNSPILGCVDYEPEHYGDRILNLAVRMLNGETTDTINYTTHNWISRETVLAGDTRKNFSEL
jgi:ribose transport system substrate-binding protein